MVRAVQSEQLLLDLLKEMECKEHKDSIQYVLRNSPPSGMCVSGLIRVPDY